VLQMDAEPAGTRFTACPGRKPKSRLYATSVRQHSAADSLLKVPSQRTALILADPAACSRRCIDRDRPDLGRSAYGPASEPGGLLKQCIYPGGRAVFS
jgi:hypothetical protein